jgi:hypothetical protein
MRASRRLLTRQRTMSRSHQDGPEFEDEVPDGLVAHTRYGLRWVLAHRQEIFSSVDFKLGAVTFVIVTVAAGASPNVRAAGVVVLLAEGALGMAVLAVSLTALAILVGLLDDRYRQVLEKATGLRAAFTPYQEVAGVAALCALSAIAGAAMWAVELNAPLAAWLRQAVALGFVSGLAVWAIVGTAQLVNLTAFHGTERARLLEGIDHARKEAGVREIPSARSQ